MAGRVGVGASDAECQIHINPARKNVARRRPRPLLLLLLAAAFVLGNAAGATVGEHTAFAKHDATSCNIAAGGERYPVTYLERHRQNPDGTFYPGDAFYYLFWWHDKSEPGECGMKKPVLETGGLWLNHTAVLRGPLLPETGAVLPVPRPWVQHSSIDPTVALTESVHYHASKDGGSCQIKFAKPGESWRVKWTKYTIYDEPFLVRQDDSSSSTKLTDFEKTKALKSPGSAAWEHWRTHGKMRGGSADLPACPFDSRPPAAYGRLPPVSLTHYGSGIFYTTIYEWRLVQNASAPHAHDREVLADDGTRHAFDARVSKVCDALPPDAGCMYGTAEIRPSDGQTCLYTEIERRLGPEWLGNGDKDADGIPDDEESPEDGPPPLYLPPGVPAAQYRAPANNECLPAQGNPVLKLTIEGSYITPHHRTRAGIEYPISGIKTVTVDKSPPMHNSTLHAILTKPPLLHAEGRYDAQNLDGTYYHDDPIHIRHEPSWKWKDERSAHINFTTHRLHSYVPIDDAFDCITGLQDARGTCKSTTATSSAKWAPELKQYGNGGGRTVHVAGTIFDYGIYGFAYNMTAYNLGVPVAGNNGMDHTEAVLVPYAPAYGVTYAYPVLRDGDEYAFGDRRGLVAKYMGSMGGQEYGLAANSVLYPERRSYVNDWLELGTGSTPFHTEYYDTPHVLDEARSIKATKHVAESARPDHAVVIEYEAPAQAAMFIQQGYGTLLFEWDAMPFVYEQDASTSYREGASRENVTSYIHLWSADFAGRDTPLLESILRYPETPFAKQLTVMSVNQTGHIQHQDALELRIVPYRDANLTAEYITDYMRDKVMWDTQNDAWITQAVLDDTHDMQQYYRGGGKIDANVLRNSIYFDDYIMQADSVDTTYGQDAFGLGDFLFELAGRPETVRLSAPMDVGFGALSPVEMRITVNDTEHVIRHKYYAFGGSEYVYINARHDNVVRAERIGGWNHGSIIEIRQPENFGIITAIDVNGTRVHQSCPAGCILSSQPASNLLITLHNAWGGTAHGVINQTIPAKEIKPADVLASDSMQITATAVAALMAVGMIYLVYQRMMPHRGENRQ